MNLSILLMSALMTVAPMGNQTAPAARDCVDVSAPVATVAKPFGKKQEKKVKPYAENEGREGKKRCECKDCNEKETAASIAWTDEYEDVLANDFAGYDIGFDGGYGAVSSNLNRSDFHGARNTHSERGGMHHGMHHGTHHGLGSSYGNYAGRHHGNYELNSGNYGTGNTGSMNNMNNMSNMNNTGSMNNMGNTGLNNTTGNSQQRNNSGTRMGSRSGMRANMHNNGIAQMETKEQMKLMFDSALERFHEEICEIYDVATAQNNNGTMNNGAMNNGAMNNGTSRGVNNGVNNNTRLNNNSGRNSYRGANNTGTGSMGVNDLNSGNTNTGMGGSGYNYGTNRGNTSTMPLRPGTPRQHVMTY